MNERDGTKLVPISAEIEGTLRDEIKELAAGADRSFSAEVRRALRWYALNEPVIREQQATRMMKGK